MLRCWYGEYGACLNAGQPLRVCVVVVPVTVHRKQCMLLLALWLLENDGMENGRLSLRGRSPKQIKSMKLNLSLLSIVGLLGCSLATMAQTNPPAAEVPAATPAPAAAPAAAAAAPSQPGAIIPIIIMDDVPLTDAIKNLARQASLNY